VASSCSGARCSRASAAVPLGSYHSVFSGTGVPVEIRYLYAVYSDAHDVASSVISIEFTRRRHGSDAFAGASE